MAQNIRPEAEAARENARTSTGRFGHQENTPPEQMLKVGENESMTVPDHKVLAALNATDPKHAAPSLKYWGDATASRTRAAIDAARLDGEEMTDDQLLAALNAHWQAERAASRFPQMPDAQSLDDFGGETVAKMRTLLQAAAAA